MTNEQNSAGGVAVRVEADVGALTVKTERAEAFADNGWWVRHVFRASDDGRRTTNFYPCANRRTAEILESALRSNAQVHAGRSPRVEPDVGQDGGK